MRAPLGWLAEYVDVAPGTTGEQVAAALVKVGLEEEGVHGGEITGPLVVGRVLEFVAEPQKNGKTIRWCQVDVGNPEPQGIVCGASNFEVGDLVVCSLPGAVLPGGFAIAARKTYGHVSDGMICSARELGLGDDHDGIIRLNEWGIEAKAGEDAITLLGLAEETVEVAVTPDRGYAFSLRGIAREYSHATGGEFRDPAAVEEPAATADGFPVELRDESPIRGRAGCDRYVARVVTGVDASRPSPRWMQRRLEQAGMRPISLAVDVTNYVMLGLGQPLHAFDLDRLTGPVVVRRARAGEKLTTLDDVVRKLDPEDLLITDAGGEHLLALGGVMGGASSEVTPQTRNVLIEAAHFDPVTVARTARRHKLSTEASRRFERGVDDDLAGRAAEVAVRLLVEHGGGVPGPVTDVDHRAPRGSVRMPVTLPNQVTGSSWTDEQVVGSLREIGCEVSGEAVLEVLPPSWRPDLAIGVDLVEEVARIQGYEDIPVVLPVAPAGRGLTHAQHVRRTVARALADAGLVEVLDYPFVSPGVHDAFGLDADDDRRHAVRLANPLSDEAPELRTSLLPPLLETLKRNVGRGTTDVALYEIGTVFLPGPAGVGSVPVPPLGARPAGEVLAGLDAGLPHQPRHVAAVFAGRIENAGWWGPGRPADWTDAVATARLVAATLNLELDVEAGQHAPWHPGRCARLSLGGTVVGYAGELHPKVVAALGLPERTAATELDLGVLTTAAGIRRAGELSTFPVAKEDVALVVDAAVPAETVRRHLAEGAGGLLESVRLFDVYTGPQIGEGKRSLAFALRFRAPDRTLTAEESGRARDAAVAAAASGVGAVQR